MVRGEHVYLAIDLKSFYASVECHDRGLDPLRTHLVVADEERTDKTICLAVSPSLKAYGIPGRARLFEVRQRLASVNAERAMLAPGGRLSGESCDSQDLEHSPRLKASMVIAKPRMAHYLEVSGSGRRLAPPRGIDAWRERIANVRNAFSCSADHSGRHVVLVDDVMTTGASLDECARTLKLHGAARVSVLVVARALPKSTATPADP